LLNLYSLRPWIEWSDESDEFVDFELNGKDISLWAVRWNVLKVPGSYWNVISSIGLANTANQDISYRYFHTNFGLTGYENLISLSFAV